VAQRTEAPVLPPDSSHGPRVTLLLGGARSGKSSQAEALALRLPQPRALVATAEGLDEEMAARIARHRADRGPGWTTVEVPLDLPQALLALPPHGVVVVDCLTLWLSNLMLAGRDTDAAFVALEAALAACPTPVILVANEVGLGIVPDNALARAFRDLAGILNRRMAALADEVIQVVAGLPQVLKAHRPAPDPGAEPAFSEAFREDLGRLLHWRRDVRRFRPTPLPEGMLAQLIASACLAPSVGLSEPWRFVHVASAEGRACLGRNFAAANARALEGQEGERARLYASLKLAGLAEAPVLLAVFVESDTAQGHGLGRASMPETVAYSVVCAIHTLWLAARAEGIGLGWVSILDPVELAASLATPANWHPVALLCLGYPETTGETPELETAGWERRRMAPVILQR
jgi:5,6-dimethylbenzimidazole synthase